MTTQSFSQPNKRIVATSVSWDVSRKLADEDWKASRQALGSFGPIEPELLGSVPRNVRSVTVFDRQTTWIGLGITVLGTVLCRSLETIFAATPELGIAMICGGVLAVIVASFCHKHSSCNPQLLEKGIPSRAIVVTVENRSPDAYNRWDEDILKFSYRYRITGGIYRFGYFSLTRRRSWQLAITAGTTFTVLYTADDSEDAMPYFLITGKEIVGAIGAKITPP